MSGTSLARSVIDRDDLDFLSLLSVPNRRRLLEGSTQAVYPAGAVAIRPGGPRSAFLIDSGLSRAYWTIPNGSQTTVAIFRPHEIVGATTFVDNPPWTFVQTITESTLTILDMENVRAMSEREVQFGMAMATHLSMRIRDAYRLIAVRSLGNIRERVAYDLLDRASQSQLVIGRLEVAATHGQLADSIGTSREVLSRAIGDLRAAGIVETAPGVVRVLDPQRLADIVSEFVM
jgi:CRP/FNR family transcriptional regulator, cyclic AMP receptor protein